MATKELSCSNGRALGREPGGCCLPWLLTIPCPSIAQMLLAEVKFMAVPKHTLRDKQAILQMSSRAENVTSICALAMGVTESSWALVRTRVCKRVQECVKVCKGVQGCV